MEQNVPIVAKKIWKMVRVIYYMLRKEISKGKLFADLNMMMKRGKIAGKSAIKNLMLNHHHHHAAASPSTSGRRSHDYEFSCSSNSPAAYYPKKRRHSKSAQPSEEDLMAAAVEMVNSAAAASPVLPGFGPSPNVRKLRVTDSPFPLRDDVDEDCHVDEAAEVFIMNFYKDLRLQNSKAYYLGYC
ncbi:hypothetical protein ABFS82_04G099200 [Erythranthe guttata]|uniref:Uncharacterized protein n=1 Tax=Erythranthe guttata TaxID=4155 RepID=A0A022Q7N5_ERYGU|nr:PREDICTED: uncharacterized protein LOC105972276 [Erythranthe guttata]EYU24717.1 hypothetical protein MIMGU_mgv1a018991mg [Erythranthe guttata]|eukprot:XP_012852665.1 PREDICTED: uncharacterized protein LOC105972276 [Erythranthe guttata]